MNGRVVVALITEQQEFQRLQAQEARDTAARLGLEAEVLFADGSAARQAQQLGQVVRLDRGERPAAILVETVIGEGLERVARDAVAAGIGWVLLNRDVPYLDALRREHGEVVVSMVSADQEEVGRIQGRQFRALLPRGGRVLYVQGPPDTSVAQQRLRGAEEWTRDTGIRLDVVCGDWTETSGEQAVASWLGLRPPEDLAVDLVGCQNDAMAIGARRAVATLRPDWAEVRYTGCDGLPEGGRRLVDQGLLAATIVTPSNTGPALERVAAWLAGGPLPPRDILLEPHSYPSEALIRP